MLDLKCGYIFEENELDCWKNSRHDVNYDTNYTIELPTCPKCKTPIRVSRQYSNVIKKQLMAINELCLLN